MNTPVYDAIFVHGRVPHGGDFATAFGVRLGVELARADRLTPIKRGRIAVAAQDALASIDAPAGMAVGACVIGPAYAFAAAESEDVACRVALLRAARQFASLQ